MTYVQRSFCRFVDWIAITNVVLAQPHAHLHITDLPYRLCSWAFDDAANGVLWETDSGTVHAWAALQSPFWCIDYAIHPAALATLLHDVLAWANQIEPMGIRADLRGQGLGKALLLACLQRLKAAGALSLFVETDNYRDAAYAQYQSVGFHVHREILVYRRDVA